MISNIRGKIIYKSTDYLTVDVNGLGYEVFVPLSTYYDIPEEGGEVSLFVKTIVREDAFLLYGFLNLEDKKFFILLTSVSGIGPKLAMNILSGATAPEIASAISTGNVPMLVAFPGVGKKTAERMVVELKDKLKDITVTAGTTPKPHRTVQDDVVSALVNMGYKQPLAEQVVGTTDSAQVDFEKIFKEALKKLSDKG